MRTRFEQGCWVRTLRMPSSSSGTNGVSLVPRWMPCLRSPTGSCAGPAGADVRPLTHMVSMQQPKEYMSAAGVIAPAAPASCTRLHRQAGGRGASLAAGVVRTMHAGAPAPSGKIATGGAIDRGKCGGCQVVSNSGRAFHGMQRRRARCGAGV